MIKMVVHGDIRPSYGLFNCSKFSFIAGISLGPSMSKTWDNCCNVPASSFSLSSASRRPGLCKTPVHDSLLKNGSLSRHQEREGIRSEIRDGRVNISFPFLTHLGALSVLVLSIVPSNMWESQGLHLRLTCSTQNKKSSYILPPQQLLFNRPIRLL